MTQAITCQISGRSFSISENERALRKKLGAPEPTILPKYMLRHLMAFWQHFNLHRRECDYSKENIVSVYDEHCPYPVWKREHWLQNASPPSAEYDFSRPFFEQLWNVFRRCPIPHNIEVGNENCAYTDDWWYSKNCYLCHSGVNCEDCHYCYRNVNLKNCQFCVFCFDCELSVDLANCNKCFSVVNAAYSRNCQDSAFLFDCRNCSNCLFCWNLRSKNYYIRNRQVSKEEFNKVKEALNLSSRAAYLSAVSEFRELVQSRAFWKAQQIEKCTNCSGNYLENSKNLENCYYLSESEDCVNFIRGHKLKDTVDSTGNLMAELCYLGVLVQDRCYDVRCGYNLVKCRDVHYSAHCYGCESCFACCGLVNGKFCILNAKYSEQEYGEKIAKIKAAISEQGLRAEFFPAYFAANNYNESLAAYHFPLSLKQQEELGFRFVVEERLREKGSLSPDEIPDDSLRVSEEVCSSVFWDDDYSRPFRVQKFDVEFAKDNKVPLPYCYYVKRLKALFSWMSFDGGLRETTCAGTGKQIYTTLPGTLDGRILSEQAYLDFML